MDNIGKLYAVKRHYWYVFPDRHMAMVAPSAYSVYESTLMTKEFNAHTSYLKPNDVVVLLKEGNLCKEVLLPNGDIGWIAYHDWCFPYFEEIVCK